MKNLFGLLLIFVFCTNTAVAQDSTSVLYVPLIGITSVPHPLALPQGPGNVTYKYAVKNFLPEVALTDIEVVDTACSPIHFLEGDDNHDSRLDYQETWRYSCTVRLTSGTESTATVTGLVGNVKATHKAYANVLVGSGNPPPLVSIVNITKVAYPLALPQEGGNITFTYKVNNPGVVPLSNVVVTDNKCQTLSGKLGDTNGNNLLDPSEVWIYTCTANLKETTTNTAHVTASANGLKAIGRAELTVQVETPKLPDTGTVSNLKIKVWIVQLVVLAVLVIIYLARRK